jgi:hypothetical protein
MSGLFRFNAVLGADGPAADAARARKPISMTTPSPPACAGAASPQPCIDEDQAMPQNWWDKFPEVMPSPAARPYPLPGPGGIMPGPAMGLGPDPLSGAPLLGQDPVGPFDPSYFSGGQAAAGQFPGSTADQAMSFGYPQPPLAGDQAGALSDRKLAVQQAAAAIRDGADPRAVRARLNQVGTDNPNFDLSDLFSDLLPGGGQAPDMMNPPQGPQPDPLSGGQPPFARDFMPGGYDTSGLAGGVAAQLANSPDPGNFQPPQGLIGPDGGSLDQIGSFAGLQSGLDPGSYAAAYAQNPSGTLLANQLGIGFNDTGYRPAGSVSDLQGAQPGDDFANHMRAVVNSLPPDPAGRAQPLPPEHALSGPPAQMGSDGAIVVTGPPRAARDALRQGTRLIRLTPEDILNIKKVLQTEWVQRAGTDQARGIIDTILNRLASGHWGSTISAVVNGRRQFSAINGPYSEGRHSVEEYPSSRVSRIVNDFVDRYLAERANGAPSIIGTNLNYANPVPGRGTTANNMPWVRRLQGPTLGIGRAIHVHGTAPENQRFRPGPYSIVLPRPVSAPPGR